MKIHKNIFWTMLCFSIIGLLDTITFTRQLTWLAMQMDVQTLLVVACIFIVVSGIFVWRVVLFEIRGRKLVLIDPQPVPVEPVQAVKPDGIDDYGVYHDSGTFVADENGEPKKVDEGGLRYFHKSKRRKSST
ncbi:MAG: hypothetical protein AAFQ92_22630 [Bacteroidota bacterium]